MTSEIAGDKRPKSSATNRSSAKAKAGSNPASAAGANPELLEEAPSSTLEAGIGSFSGNDGTDANPNGASKASSRDPASALGATAAAAPSTSEHAGLVNRRPLKSNKLDSTLAELENAFAAWDSITEDGGKNAAREKAPPAGKAAANANATQTGENDFRSKTRKLLNQLREQLADLSED